MQLKEGKTHLLNFLPQPHNTPLTLNISKIFIKPTIYDTLPPKSHALKGVM
jgi:hypothetical protein